jgi:hypothetical protein
LVETTSGSITSAPHPDRQVVAGQGVLGAVAGGAPVAEDQRSETCLPGDLPEVSAGSARQRRAVRGCAEQDDGGQGEDGRQAAAARGRSGDERVHGAPGSWGGVGGRRHRTSAVDRRGEPPRSSGRPAGEVGVPGHCRLGGRWSGGVVPVSACRAPARHAGPPRSCPSDPPTWTTRGGTRAPRTNPIGATRGSRRRHGRRHGRSQRTGPGLRRSRRHAVHLRRAGGHALRRGRRGPLPGHRRPGQRGPRRPAGGPPR